MEEVVVQAAVAEVGVATVVGDTGVPRANKFMGSTNQPANSNT